MIKQNLHTHSIYCDGKDTIEEMVQAAIQKNFTILGFSGHGYCRPIDDYSMHEDVEKQYIQDVQMMKKKYADQIQIYLGIEQDVLGKRFDHCVYDYIIGSVHFVSVGTQYLPVDHSKEMTNQILKHFHSFYAFAKAYYEEVKKLAYMEEVDIIGHLDVCMKFNEDASFISFDDEAYLQLAYDCIDVCVKHQKIFEINTGAIARGYRTMPYPHKSLLQYINKQGGKICISSDCHNKNDLDCFYEEVVSYMKECGFTSMMILTPQGFQSVEI